MDKKDVMPNDKTEKKQKYCTNLLFRHTIKLSLALVRACIAPVCHFETKGGVVTHKEKFKPCWGNVKEANYVILAKINRVENGAG